MARKSENDWLVLFNEHKQSGQTQEAFCQERGLNPRYFSLKKSKILGSSRTKKPAFTKVLPRTLSHAMVLKRGAIELHFNQIEPSVLIDIIEQLS